MKSSLLLEQRAGLLSACYKIAVFPSSVFLLGDKPTACAGIHLDFTHQWHLEESQLRLVLLAVLQ